MYHPPFLVSWRAGHCGWPSTLLLPYVFNARHFAYTCFIDKSIVDCQIGFEVGINLTNAVLVDLSDDNGENLRGQREYDEAKGIKRSDKFARGD